MNKLKWIATLLLATALFAGCAGHASSDPSGSGSGPEIISQTTGGLSATASSDVTRSTGVVEWEIQRTATSMEVQGLDRGAKLVLDMNFDLASHQAINVLDQLAHTSMVIDEHGTVVKNDFSTTSQAQFDAISHDATILHVVGSAPNLKPQSGVLHSSCTKCFGVVLFCGSLEFSDPNQSGQLECDQLSACGVCICIGWGC